MDLPTPPPSTAKDYDALPYQSIAYAKSSPERMAALAHLFGQTPTPPANARVLELGCASGGNIIPLAVRFPEAQFVGVDLSQGQVAEGQERIAALGLKNIEIRFGDITTVDFGEASFDYLVAHGVFSWIPEEAQDAMFAIARRSLVPGGLAYISYNTYPGWHMLQTVRDLCMFHAGTKGEPKLRVDRARWMLDKLGNLPGNGIYEQLFRQESEANARQHDSYILGEFLADHNLPCYFHEFASRAQKHGMAFLCEANLGESLPESLGKDTASLVREIAGDNGLALEQYMDFFSGRQFRSSILIRPPEDGVVTRALSPARMSELHMASSWRPVPDQKRQWKLGKKTRDATPLDHTILTVLRDAAPATVAVEEVISTLRRSGTIQSDEAAAQVVTHLFRLSLADGIEVLTLPRRAGRASDAMPELCPLARLEAASGQRWLSTRRHTSATLKPGFVSLLPLIDGTRSVETLEAVVIESIKSGKLRRGGQDMGAELDDAGQADLAHRLVSDVLGWLERVSLLVPSRSA